MLGPFKTELALSGMHDWCSVVQMHSKSKSSVLAGLSRLTHTSVIFCMHEQLADHSWNQENPGWLRATVYAAQYASAGWSQEDHPPDGLRRCAACAVQIPECQGKARCSKCKLV